MIREELGHGAGHEDQATDLVVGIARGSSAAERKSSASSPGSTINGG